VELPGVQGRVGEAARCPSRHFDLQPISRGHRGAARSFAFERYYATSGLFGTPESCVAMVDSLKAHGRRRVACLIDFGVDSASVLEHLPC
jgi:hypothetical protein